MQGFSVDVLGVSSTGAGGVRWLSTGSAARLVVVEWGGVACEDKQRLFR